MTSDLSWAQAFIELRAEDPEATSASRVARARLAAAAGLLQIRRFRLFELAGALPPATALGQLLHRSTQFYNPSKERCFLRSTEGERSPLRCDEHAVLVFERAGDRRAAAERWWRHETGARIQVREGVVWALTFAPGEETLRSLESITLTLDRQQGLLCNPHFQECRLAPECGVAPWPWIASKPTRRALRARRGTAA